MRAAATSIGMAVLIVGLCILIISGRLGLYDDCRAIGHGWFYCMSVPF